ncbi:hypothetical protein Achl_2883 [Pseudarthrobacter chlorophenolicus A6]|uniref:Uncharacterized protein n=1 Tax=Pseudarthrobacter chlorophenolicus (strain ATCC 700700 / DSM 12829 / CIP 107037 / JCM 12360 / KCTC 9906 / NCIMB 13794 / A6) TaxID=452863 RepID=B8HDX9_PSECP|nr:hypothetical protein Achl_2883 [Pseudarthrobacter chlorophenolicus A6]
MLWALLCKLNIRHEWHLKHAEDGRRYKECQRCRRIDDWGGSWTHAPAGWQGP